MTTSATEPDVPERAWTNPFNQGTPLHDLFGRIVRQERDLIIIIDDWHARRGTGKTVSALQLANKLDQTAEGITKDKVAIQPEELRIAYSTQPIRSGLVLDEAEVGVSNRQAMSKANQALREIMSMGRIEQKYVVINAPSKGFIDKDIRQLADVWITVMRKGLGLVHYFERQPYSDRLLTPKKQTIEIDDIPKGTQLREVYNYLTKEKRQRISNDESGSGYITKQEHQKEVDKVDEQARREGRDEAVVSLYRHEDVDLSYQKIADALGMSKPGVQGIFERFEEDE